MAVSHIGTIATEADMISYLPQNLSLPPSSVNAVQIQAVWSLKEKCRSFRKQCISSGGNSPLWTFKISLIVVFHFKKLAPNHLIDANNAEF